MIAMQITMHRQFKSLNINLNEITVSTCGASISYTTLKSAGSIESRLAGMITYIVFPDDIFIVVILTSNNIVTKINYSGPLCH